MSTITTEIEREMNRLSALRAADLTRLIQCDAYYEGVQPLRFVAPELLEELGDRIPPLVLNWARLVADTYENRLDIEGFRYPRCGPDDKGEMDQLLWETWQANDGPTQSQQGHTETLVEGRSYVMVGHGDSVDDAPVMTVESPLQTITSTDPRTRKTRSGLKEWVDEDKVAWRLFLGPDADRTFYRKGRRWVEDQIFEHGFGECRIVCLSNRGRMLRSMGVSEFADVIPIADAANKMATDMMISGEFHAMPRRWAFGFSEDDFVDSATGRKLNAWRQIAGRLWASERKPEEVKVGQFPEADLSVFHNTIKLLAQVAAQLAALPPSYLGFTGDNPASADAMRAAETQLIKRAERKIQALSPKWEQVNRLILRTLTGQWDPKAKLLEVLWRDPATPTEAQKTDAVVKKFQAGIIPVEQAREDLGYTPEQISRMAEYDQAATDSLFPRLMNPGVEDGEPTPSHA